MGQQKMNKGAPEYADLNKTIKQNTRWKMLVYHRTNQWTDGNKNKDPNDNIESEK